MAYYVYHDTAYKRARVHDGACVHCNNGTGQINQAKTDQRSTGWSHAFATVADAEAYINQQFPHFTDKRSCGHCLPGQA